MRTDTIQYTNLAPTAPPSQVPNDLRPTDHRELSSFLKLSSALNPRWMRADTTTYLFVLHNPSTQHDPAGPRPHPHFCESWLWAEFASLDKSFPWEPMRSRLPWDLVRGKDVLAEAATEAAAVTPRILSILPLDPDIIPLRPAKGGSSWLRLTGRRWPLEY